MHAEFQAKTEKARVTVHCDFWCPDTKPLNYGGYPSRAGRLKKRCTLVSGASLSFVLWTSVFARYPGKAVILCDYRADCAGVRG